MSTIEEEVGSYGSQSLRFGGFAVVVAVGLSLGACGAEEGANMTSTATKTATEHSAALWPENTPVVTGDWLDIERAPLLALQPTIEAAPVATEAPTVERAVAAGQHNLPPSPGGCPDVIVEVFGANAPAACAVAWCESRWSAWAVGDHGASLGLFQIQPRWHQWRVPGEDLADPSVNTRAAFTISSGGIDWSAWTCQP